MLRITARLTGGPCTQHAASVAVGSEVYAFGDLCFGEISRDQIEVHVLNTVSLRWRKLPLVTTERGERPPEVPSQCLGHTAVLIEDIVYIWGGCDTHLFNFSFKYYDVLYAFDLDAHSWFRPEVSGSLPQERMCHSACVLEKVMYVFGGAMFCGKHWVDEHSFSKDIYKLDTTTMVWSSINIRGTPPPTSIHHSATIIGKKMFVFGGIGGQSICNDLSVFDIETNCWMRTPSADLWPKFGSTPSAFAHNEELCLLKTNYLWKCNPEISSWKKVEPKGKTLCWTDGMCCCKVGDRIILFGGFYRPSIMYILDLSPSLKTLCKLAVIQFSLEQSGLPHDIRWELANMTTNSK